MCAGSTQTAHAGANIVSPERHHLQVRYLREKAEMSPLGLDDSCQAEASASDAPDYAGRLAKALETRRGWPRSSSENSLLRQREHRTGPRPHTRHTQPARDNLLAPSPTLASHWPALRMVDSPAEVLPPQEMLAQFEDINVAGEPHKTCPDCIGHVL